MSTDDRFDEAIRAIHAQSLEHVSPRVRAQLQQRRRSAVRAQSTARGWRFALPLAAAAAVVAIVVGVNVRTSEPTSTPQVATTLPAPSVSAVLAHATAASADASTDYASLDESPDLYVWLASDGASLAME